MTLILKGNDSLSVTEFMIGVKANWALERKELKLAEMPKGSRAPHENVETNDPLVSAPVPLLKKQVVRKQHSLSHTKRPVRFFSPSLIKWRSQWEAFRAYIALNRVKDAIEGRGNNYARSRSAQLDPGLEAHLWLCCQFSERRRQAEAGECNCTFSW